MGSLKVLEGVFNGLQTAWTALKDIGKGIEPSLAPIGESLKRTFGHMGDTEQLEGYGQCARYACHQPDAARWF
ncbi:hypothetical protein HGG75_05075 [Ochrobactrum pseudogrignonense]|nr:hypothetical protein [Brucella pseudogrignonensis]